MGDPAPAADPRAGDGGFRPSRQGAGAALRAAAAARPQFRHRERARRRGDDDLVAGFPRQEPELAATGDRAAGDGAASILRRPVAVAMAVMLAHRRDEPLAVPVALDAGDPRAVDPD